MHIHHTLLAKRPIQVILFIFGIACISLVAIQPYTLNQMPETADGLLHLYRVATVDYSLKVDNPLWMRYSTGIVYGYGAPLFNYFPPLSYYFSSWLHTLGMTFVQSWLMTMTVYTMLSASGMYMLGHIWTGSNVGGWVSALSMIYAPYFLFDSVARGTSSELAALAILPFVLYGFTRLAFYGRRNDFLIAVGVFALFIPMHTLMTLHGTALLATYCLFLWVNSEEKTRTVIRLSLSGGLALMITAFFWLPAFVETDAVKINLIAENLNQIDVTQHLRPLHEVLALPFTADPTRMAQSIPITLSWMQLGISFVGTIIALRHRHRLLRNLLLGSWLVLLFLIFMNTPLSVWLWENVPLIGYTQFPWRVMGLASLILALTTGIGVWLILLEISRHWLQSGVFLVIGLALVIYSIPWTYSLYLADIELEDITDVHNFERDTGQLTVSSYSEYLPVSTDESQLDPNRLVERFEQNDIIPRLLDSDTLTIHSADWTSTSGRLVLKSSVEQILLFDWLYIDGWKAEIDGRTVDVYPSQPIGLVSVDVPQGQFELSISLQATAIQSASVLLSIGGLSSLIMVLILWRSSDSHVRLVNVNYPDAKGRIYVLVILVGLSAFFGKALILDSTNSPFKIKRFGQLSDERVDILRLANFGGLIDLIDTEWAEDTISGRFINIKLYWMLHEMPIAGDYSTIVRLRDSNGIVMAEAISFQPGGWSTHNWLQDAYILDSLRLKIPRLTLPLNDEQFYTLDIGVFDPQTQEQLSVINEVGNPEDVKYVLGPIYYPASNPQTKQDRLVEVDAVRFGDAPIGLYRPAELPQLEKVATIGDEIIYHWTWQKVAEPDGDDIDYVARIVWLDDDNNLIGHTSLVSPDSSYDMQRWSIGEALTTFHRVYVPATLPAGDYHLGIQLLDKSEHTYGQIFMLDEVMQVALPNRIFDMPVVEVETVDEWDNGIHLLGYSVDSVEMGLQLHWHTDKIINNSLRLFVHLMDENELIVAQSDGVPVDWTRPTTSWVNEEYVTTVHRFDVEFGDYDIRIGWYDPITGIRVDVGDADSIIIEDGFTIK